jgi:4-amino-4-deoxy-L-arabinose transferase-like glycosyltransferase
MKHSFRGDGMIAIALTVIGALLRVPYLALVPTFGDEVMQTVQAMSIRPGEYMPLVGVDPYSGPFFPYLIAVIMRVLGATPVAPRIVVMVMGALTVGLTYLLGRELGLTRPWAALAGLLLAANPHHILVSSHYAGATLVLPLFTTALLVTLVLAAKRESGAWLVAAGALVGLALQANPVTILMLPGAAVWFLAQRKAAIGLRTRWPYLAALAAILVYSPVIVHNVQTGLSGVDIAQTQRQYLWQTDPSLSTYAQNLARMMLQLCRQVGGVLEGNEDVWSLMGMPLVFSAWAIAGLAYALVARKGFSLLTLSVGPHLLLMPWWSNYYGIIAATHLTNQLTPPVLLAMSALAAGMWRWAAERIHRPESRRAIAWVAGVVLTALALSPLVSLFQYYDHSVANDQTNAPYLAFADEFARLWHGERVLLDDSLIGFLSDQDPNEYKPTAYLLAVSGVPFDYMPAGRILERLAAGQETGRVIVIVRSDNVQRFQEQADLIPWESPAIEAVNNRLGSSMYTIADAQKVRKPSFVFASAADAPAVRAVQANFADRLELVGYDLRPAKFAPGSTLTINLHWRAWSAMSEAYTGFLHLIGPDGQLKAQDDHELGRGFYRTFLWQPNEVIRERYTISVPRDAPSGDYVLRVGVYSFPSLKRLDVKASSEPTQDNTVTLDTIHIEP